VLLDAARRGAPPGPPRDNKRLRQSGVLRTSAAMHSGDPDPPFRRRPGVVAPTKANVLVID